ncbi:oligosaccharide flippase family protein [bacterium AH-315-P15]|nr:oligosaccharide flippase family protein [bacterium AH-315-P15]
MLAPTEFGIVALAVALVSIVDLLTTFSLSTIYLQRRSSTSLMTAIVLAIFGIVALKIVVGLSVYLFNANKYDTEVWQLFGLVFASKLLTPLNSILIASLEKSIQFVRSTLIVNSANLAAIAAAIWAVSSGWGPFGLVLREILPVIFSLGACFALVNGLKIDLRRVRPRQLRLVAISSLQMYALRATEIGFTKIPQLVVHSLFGAEALGLISQASYLVNTSNRATNVLNQQMGIVFFSLFRKNRESMRKGGGALFFVTMGISVPVSLILYFYPERIVELLWGHRWIGAAALLKFMSFAAILLPVYTLLKSYLYGVRRHNYITVGYAVSTTLIVGLIYVSYLSNLGLPYIAAAISLSYAALILLALPGVIQRPQLQLSD